uniref:Putative sulfotransferase n=1 Tax=Ornithodoros turicata TaxID=34597 RepID=A0A2R5LIG4_9ACAR
MIARVMQWKVVASVCVILCFGALYVRFENRFAVIDASRLKLTETVGRLQMVFLNERLHEFPPVQQSQTDAPLDDFGLPEGAMDNLLILYNRVPKTGSTSFMGVAYDLCGTNKFHVLHVNTSKNMHVMPLPDQIRFAYNITLWSSIKPAIYHGHIAFLDFTRLGISKNPIYINIIRRPLDRLVSYFYFLRHGDDFRPYLVRRRQGNKMTFDECVSTKGIDCAEDKMWLQVPFFCGQAADCWIPGNPWALAQAKQNLINSYFLVGLTEHLEDFVAVLEASFPRIFRGATKKFLSGKKTHLRKTFNKQEPSKETVATVMQSRVWQMENDFYEFAAEQFDAVKKRTLTSSTLEEGVPKQLFFYEKIRPK